MQTSKVPRFEFSALTYPFLVIFSASIDLQIVLVKFRGLKKNFDPRDGTTLKFSFYSVYSWM